MAYLGIYLLLGMIFVGAKLPRFIKTVGEKYPEQREIAMLIAVALSVLFIPFWVIGVTASLVSKFSNGEAKK